MKEYNFRVTRIRCWRLTTSSQDKLNGCAINSNSSSSSSSCLNNGTPNTRFELSFEYLISKDQLQWITVVSDQVDNYPYELNGTTLIVLLLFKAILMSICLQGMVEELLMKRNGKKIRRDDQNGVMINGKADRRGSWSYMKRDGSCHQIALPRSVSTDAGLSNSAEVANKVSNNNPKSFTVINVGLNWSQWRLPIRLSMAFRPKAVTSWKTTPSMASETSVTTTYRSKISTLFDRNIISHFFKVL